MRFCSKNRTFAVIESRIGNFVLVESKAISGVIGSLLHKHFDLDKKNLCKPVGVDSFGSKASNGSYTGALGLLKSKQIDFFGRPSSIYLNEDFVTLSDGFYEGGFFAGNSMRTKQDNDDKANDLLQIFKVEFKLRFFPPLFFILIFFLLYMLLPKFNWIRKTELIILNLSQFNFRLVRSLNIISLILIFYSLYHVIFVQLLINNVKSDIVIVNTSSIVLTKEDLMTTRRTIFYWEHTFEYNLIENAIAGNKAKSSIFRENNTLYTCIKDQSLLNEINLDNAVVILDKTNIISLAMMISHLFADIFFFVSKKRLINVTGTLFLKSNIDREFLKMAQFVNEFGLEAALEDKIFSVLYSTFMFRTRVFMSKSEYIGEFTKQSHIKLDDFKFLAYLYLTVNSLIFICFIFSIMFKKFHRKVRKITVMQYKYWKRMVKKLFRK